MDINIVEKRLYDTNWIVETPTFPCPCNPTGSIFSRDLISFDVEKEIISIQHIKGSDPLALNIIQVLLSLPTIRTAIKKYNETYQRKENFAITHTSGQSGRVTYYISFYSESGIQVKSKKLLYVSGEEKLNNGWNDMWIGDFVEFVAYLQEASGVCWAEKKPEELIEASGVNFLKLYFNFEASNKKHVLKLSDEPTN